MEQTKHGAQFVSGGHAANAQPGNQVVNMPVNVSYQGGHWKNANGPVQAPPVPSSAYAAVGTIPTNGSVLAHTIPSSAYAAIGTIPDNQMFMGQIPNPGQNLYRERERDRIPPAKPGTLPTPPCPPIMGTPQQRYSEWDCPKCNGHNYANQEDCFKCGMKKPLNTAATLPGDWYCLSCSAHNYANRDLCLRCQKKKSPETQSISWSGNRRPGDWDCPKCKGHNYASRSTCFRCELQKPPGLAPVKTDRRPGDWDCVMCNAHNYASRTACFICKAQKSRPVVPLRPPLPTFTQLAPQYSWPPMLPMMHHIPFPQSHMMLPQQPPPPSVMRPPQLIQPAQQEIPLSTAVNGRFIRGQGQN